MNIDDLFQGSELSLLEFGTQEQHYDDKFLEKEDEYEPEDQ